MRSGKAQLWTAEEGGQLLGFLLADIWKGLVLVDYLAVSSKSRGKGTGSQLLQHVMEQYTGKRILLLIERLDERPKIAVSVLHGAVFICATVLTVQASV